MAFRGSHGPGELLKRWILLRWIVDLCFRAAEVDGREGKKIQGVALFKLGKAEASDMKSPGQGKLRGSKKGLGAELFPQTFSVNLHAVSQKDYFLVDAGAKVFRSDSPILTDFFQSA